MPTAELLKGDEEEGRGDDCSMLQAIRAKSASLSLGPAKHAIFFTKVVGFVADCSDSGGGVNLERHRRLSPGRTSECAATACH